MISLRKSLLILLIASILFPLASVAQQLKPGFDANECIDLCKVNAHFAGKKYYEKIGAPEDYRFIYQSPEMGLKYCWALWVREDKVGVIAVRGTTGTTESWLANLYSAMVPAKGTLQLSTTEQFSYDLASDPKAAVHIGWLIGVAFLSKDILPKIDSLYLSGIKDIIITGHSQGGGISYLLSSYLYSQQKQKRLPADIRFKTYCTAAPKPGNLYYAYEYEATTQLGWAYNIVNTADWVPEAPLSLQTLNDFNTVNPLKDAKGMIKKQKFPVDIVLKHYYNKLSKPAFKALKNYQKFMGDKACKYVQKSIPGYTPPAYYASNNYVRTGTTIVLFADSTYHQLYPDNNENPFCHHYFEPYIYLLGTMNN